MIAKTLRVMLTMDCERVRDSEFYPAGPATWQESARNISAFADVAEEYGFRVTFFSVPEAVEAHGDLFKKLLALGHVPEADRGVLGGAGELAAVG